MTKTARAKLAEILSFQLTRQRKSDREVSDRCGVPLRDVERWKSGELVPDRGQWKRMCQMVARSLFGCSAVYNEALKEQDEEKELALRNLRRNGHTTTVQGRAVTNFGDKLIAAAPMQTEPDHAPATAVVAISTAAEAPRDELHPKRYYPPRPAGATTHEAIAERREYARAILMQRPGIRADGADGLLELLRTRFGVGMSGGEISRLRDEVRREAIERDVRASMADGRPVTKEPDKAPVSAPTEQATAEVEQIKDADVSAGVALLVGAIPGLQEMTIKVGEDGAASVSYSVRKVQVTTVQSSLTVRR